MTAFKSLSVAMLKGFIRDKVTLFFTFLFPLMFLVIFGLILRDVGTDKTRIAVVGDGQIVSALRDSGVLELEPYNDENAAVQKVKDGDLPAALIVRGQQLDLRFAQSDQVGSATVVGIVNGFVDKANLAATGQPPRFTFAAEKVEDASLKPIQYLTPGILSWGVAVSAVFGSALTLVSWRRKQVLRRIRLAPVSATAVLSSRVLVSTGVALVQGAIFVGIAMLPVFGLQLSGSWWLAIPLLLLGTIAFFALGMLVGAFAKTEEAASAAANIVVLPMAFLSGTFFPVEQAPGWLQAVSKIFPLRHMNDGMLNVLVRGKGIEALLLPGAVLIGFTLVIAFIASRVFKWEE
ncbi:ABC-2 type transport system permease protein [Lentzea atacamensis]|uniref:ABC-2 type transport system permease protein n=1 Tax=Lentzea atacamensis TaxID=531938 RepID=A0A316I7F3_9PSEU|nr:ABC transporter permease [Lentzea atacamensis]PWK89372.1 ABC-2 type transport system permease protein [Lentzea atacamensis]RAS60781.1 ABC-2 type transport system permease protein [Lentzea atacamensis]